MANPLLLWKRMSKNFLENVSFYASYTSMLPKGWEPFRMMLYLSYGLGYYGVWGEQALGFSETVAVRLDLRLPHNVHLCP